MLLQITTTQSPATDLGHLLYKDPGRMHEWDHPFGRALVFYPEASADRCAVALMLEVDPVAPLHGRRSDDFLLAPYVNDRPYVASSFFSVAMSTVRGGATARIRSASWPARAALPAAAGSHRTRR